MEGLIDPDDHELLLKFKKQADHTKPAIVVCHNIPKFYGKPYPPWKSCEPCPPPQYKEAFAVGRAMAETDR